MGMIRLDEFSSFFKILLLLLATTATILFSLRSEELDRAVEGRILRTPISHHARHVPYGIINESVDDIHLLRNSKSYLLYSRWILDA